MQIEGFAQAVDEIALIALRHVFSARANQHEGRRARFDLREIARLDALAAYGRWRMALNGLVEPFVQIFSFNARRPIGVRLLDRLHQPIEADARLRGNRHDRRTARLRHTFARNERQLFKCCARVRNLVPLGQHINERAPFAFYKIGDDDILFLEGVFGVHHHEADVSKADSVQAIAHRHALELLLHLGFLAHPCGVDELVGLIVPIPIDGDGVARDASFRTNEQTVFAD